MPVWPFLMAVTAGLALWGWRHNAWEVPVVALSGYVAMRFVVNFTPASYTEIAGCASWLFFAYIMLRLGAWVPGFFYALSALTYPALLVFGFRLEYMGLTPVIAEIFAVLALISIGGGIYGVANSANPDGPRVLSWITSHSVGVAARATRSNRALP